MIREVGGEARFSYEWDYRPDRHVVFGTRDADGAINYPVPINTDVFFDCSASTGACVMPNPAECYPDDFVLVKRVADETPGNDAIVLPYDDEQVEDDHLAPGESRIYRLFDGDWVTT